MSSLGYGVIGLGFFGEKHAEVVRSLPGVELRAIATRDAGRRSQLAARFEVPRAYGDYRELLADPAIDAVSVVTHVNEHAAPVIAALEAGKHVLVEKPMAGSLAECDAMIAAARRSGRILMVGHICRFNPRYAVAREQIAGGAIGRVLSMHARRNIPAARSLTVLEKISPLLGDGVHDTDLMRWFSGEEVVSAFAMTHAPRGLKHPDIGWAMYRFASGAIGVIENAWCLAEGTPFRIHEQFEVIGDLGAIYIHGADQNVVVHSQGRVDCPDTLYWHQMHGQPAGALREEMAAFVSAVRCGVECPAVSLADARAAVAAVLAAERSAAEGAPVALAGPASN